MSTPESDGFLQPRHCMREPIPEIFYAAFLLDRAVGAHLAGDTASAAVLFREADMPEVRAWTESLWGSKSANPDQWKYHRFRAVADMPAHLPESQRIPVRMPTTVEEHRIIEHYGRNCVFCGIPVIHKKIREAAKTAYPQSVSWGSTNPSQHAAFQCMWMQFDHVLPHSRGGDNSLENVVITCAPCNYGRWHWTLDEVGLLDPRKRSLYKTSWDGLERFIQRLR